MARAPVTSQGPDYRDIEQIHPYEKNAKIHDKAQVKKIAASIKKFGWQGNPIVVDENGVILAGHGRRLAAIELGMKSLPTVIVSGMTEDEKKAFRLADNRAAISVMDSDMLQKELAGLADFDLADIFDKKELVFFDSDLGELNADAFVTDLDGALAHQAEETVSTIAKAAETEVPIAKVLGFKTIKGKDERAVAIFMANVEAATGLTGVEAFVAYARKNG